MTYSVRVARSRNCEQQKHGNVQYQIALYAATTIAYHADWLHKSSSLSQRNVTTWSASPNVLAQEFADRGATRRVGPLGQARIEIKLGCDALKRHEKGEDVDHRRAFLVESAGEFVGDRNVGGQESRRASRPWLLCERPPSMNRIGKQGIGRPGQPAASSPARTAPAGAHATRIVDALFIKKACRALILKWLRGMFRANPTQTSQTCQSALAFMASPAADRH